jgi:hypothetical protein
MAGRPAPDYKVVLESAAFLADKDLRGTSDPYVVMVLAEAGSGRSFEDKLSTAGYGRANKSEKVENGENPTWNQTLWFVRENNDPTAVLSRPELHCKVLDQDDVGRDESLGECRFLLDGASGASVTADLLNRRTGEPNGAKLTISWSRHEGAADVDGARSARTGADVISADAQAGAASSRTQSGGDAGLWVDDEFPPNDRSIGKTAYGEDEDGHPVEKDIVWLRPHEFGLPGALKAEPALFYEGTEAGDVVQGELGDCYLLGAMSAIAMHPQDIIEHLFLDDVDMFDDTGRCTMRFYKNGGWVNVTIDTLIPCDPRTREPIFARNAALNELWVVFLEKAYAKLHGSYAALNSGSVAESLVDLSGGVSQKLLLTDEATAAMVESGELWERTLKYLRYDYLLGCSYNVAGAEAEDEDAGKGQGILVNHAYSVLYARECGGKRFIKVRNPWGKGEWQGAWSDSSELWGESPGILAQMRADEEADFTREADGTFWMCWEDFVDQFNKIYVCRVFGSDFNQYLVKGRWEGKTAAGAHRAMMDRDDEFSAGAGSASAAVPGQPKHLESQSPKARAARAAAAERARREGAVVRAEATKGRIKAGLGRSDDGEKPAEDHVGWHHRQNGDLRWFNNPMYRVETLGRGREELFVSLSQEDRRLLRGRSARERGRGNQRGVRADTHYERPPEDNELLGDNFAIDFTVVRKPKAWATRVWEEDPSEVVAKAGRSNFASQFPQREVSKGSIQIDSRYAYYIVPHTLTAGMRCTFTLRIFCRSELSVTPVMETYSQVFRGTWQQGGLVDTSGGPLLLKNGFSNRTWCQNPQYAVFLPPDRADRTTLKVVLKRVGKKKGRKEKLGVLATRPTVDLPSSRRKRVKPPPKKHLLRDAPLPPTQPSSLSMTQQSQNAGGTGEVSVDRKLQIQPEEWAIISYFESADTSCTLLRDLTARFCERGILVVPMMDAEVDGTYQLEFHSDLPVSVRKLEEARMQTIGSSWTAGTAGGCHVDEAQWRKNPKFVIQLHGQRGEQVDVNIVLSRPEDRWADKTKRDAVGSMIGFYIIPTSGADGDAVKYRQGETFQTDFVPMNQCTSPLGFTMEVLEDDQCYIVVPCCYAPGWTGDFSLSVAADCEFTFKKYVAKAR